MSNRDNNINGLLVIDKPIGWTSFDVVAKIRGKLKVKKVGHTGTLDPMATGVLVLCLGKATKLAQEMIGLDKEYIAEVTFGATSDTDDAEGKVTQSKTSADKSSAPLSREAIEEAMKKFMGEFPQMPPQFSAKKVGGKRAYAMARKGQEVELKPVQVKVYELEILECQYPILRLRVACGKGFYVRALARDLGAALGVGGYLSALRRTKVGDFTLKEAMSVEEADESRVIKLAKN